MKEFEKIMFALKPKFGSVNDAPEMFFFDWFVFSDPEVEEAFTKKQKLLLFQLFVTHMSMELLLGNSGMSVDLQAAQPKHKLTKKQIETIWKGLSRLYMDIMKRYFDAQQLMIEKPQKPNLYESV